MNQTFISGPAIAALRITARMTENILMRRGAYGPIFWNDGIAFVARSAVERRIGQTFTDEQIAKAAAGFPHRILVIPQPETEAAA